MGKKICFVALFFFVFSFCFAQTNETITIVTYYPSPTGNYHELHADQMAIGSALRTTAPPTDSLIVGGNVGIGTGASISSRLHVNGVVRITDGTQAAGRVLTSDANGFGAWQVTGSNGAWQGWCLSQQISPGTCWGAHLPAICNVTCSCPTGYSMFGINASTPSMGGIDLIYVCVKD